MPDRAAAEALARALEAGQSGHPEADELARLLREAATAVRFDVTPQQTEQALQRVRRRRIAPSRGRAWLRPAGIALAVVAALVAGVLLTLPESSIPGFRVQARALDAVVTSHPVTHAVLHTRQTGQPTALLRDQWTDQRAGRARVVEAVDGRTISVTVAEPGRVIVYRPGARTAQVAGSCQAIPGACETLSDPIATYRDALRSGRVEDVRPVVFRDRPPTASCSRLRRPGRPVPGSSWP